LCERLDITFTRVEIDDLSKHCSQKNYSNIIISGAGILPNSLCKNHKVINAHPGFLPYSKGLDAFKWAIYNNHPIGVTTHFISDKADEGLLIEKREVPVFFEDSFGSVAQRIYETEIDMLAESIKILEENLAPLDDLSNDKYKATRRMPHHYEIMMMDKFNILRMQSQSQKSI
jgi:phosphoribosylglycinamide formyltransferase-1